MGLEIAQAAWQVHLRGTARRLPSATPRSWPGSTSVSSPPAEKPIVALKAVMRELLVRLNRMLRKPALPSPAEATLGPLRRASRRYRLHTP